MILILRTCFLIGGLFLFCQDALCKGHKKDKKVPIVVVGSTSAIKLEAVRVALKNVGSNAAVVGVKAESGVNEQPLDREVVAGAKNRIASARKLNNTGDFYIAIENGIFKTPAGQFVDKAMVVIETKAGKRYITESKDVAPIEKKYIDEAKKIGLDKITVSKVMAKHGVVEQHDDPHKTLINKPRAVILTETIEAAIKKHKILKP